MTKIERKATMFVQENEQRKVADEKAEKRRTQMEEQALNKKPGKTLYLIAE